MGNKFKCILGLTTIIALMATFFIYQPDKHVEAAREHIESAETTITEAQIGVQNALNAAQILQNELHRIDKENAVLSEAHQTMLGDYVNRASEHDAIFLDIEQRRADLLNEREQILLELQAYKLVSND
ncbi:MAG: hypothetical protein KJP00_01335 [Bacteroidia bacterium]|nr:hypothetical protein [Bacteroidia bacterium]